MNASWHADLATGVLTKLLFYENVQQWLFKKESVQQLLRDYEGLWLSKQR